MSLEWCLEERNKENEHKNFLTWKYNFKQHGDETLEYFELFGMCLFLLFAFYLNSNVQHFLCSQRFSAKHVPISGPFFNVGF